MTELPNWGRLQYSCEKWMSGLVSKVKGIGNGYWRVVAEVEDLINLAAQWQQRTIYGIGYARWLISR